MSKLVSRLSVSLAISREGDSGGRTLANKRLIAVGTALTALLCAFFLISALSRADDSDGGNGLAGLDGPAVTDCTYNDEFDSADGPYDADKWTYRWDDGTPQVPALPTVENGRLQLQLGPNGADSGVTGGGFGPQPLVLGKIGFLGQPLPAGDWEIAAKFIAPNLSQNAANGGDGIPFSRTGLMLFQSDSRQLYTFKGQEGTSTANNYWEYATRQGAGWTGASGNYPGRSGLPTTFWMRLVKTGNNVTAWYANVDPVADPSSWIPTGSGGNMNFSTTFPTADPIYFGPVGMEGASVTQVDWVRVTGDVCDVDEAAPESIHSLSPSHPNGPGGAWLPGTSFQIMAGDNVSAKADIDSFYSTDGGDTYAPYTGSVVFNSVGEHTVEYYSEDEAGNEEAPKSVTFSIAAATGNCFLSDEFTGSTLDEKWAFRWGGTDTPPALPSVSGGNLQLPYGTGEIDTTPTLPLVPGPIGFIGQQVPAGDWIVEGKFEGASVLAADPGGNIATTEAGLMLYQTDGDFVKITKRQDANSTANANWRTTSRNSGGGASNATSSSNAANGAANPFWLRLEKTGATVHLYRAVVDPSTNPGAWSQSGTATGGYNFNSIFAGADGPVYFGPVGLRGNNTLGVDYIRVLPDPGVGFSCDEVVDTQDPVTTHSFDPAVADGPGGAWLPGVELNLSATDNVSAPAGIDTYYSLDGPSGPWEDYDGPIAFDDEGEHEVHYYSEDEAGNEETPKSVDFEVAEDDVEPGDCFYSDEFDGTSLDVKWGFSWTGTTSPLPPAPTVSGGFLHQPMGAAELGAGANGLGPVAFNGQQVPAGDWEIVTQVNGANINTPDTVGYSQAGLMLYQNDQNFIKLVKIQTEDGANAFWESASRNGAGAAAATNNWPGDAGIGGVNTFWLRMVKVDDRLHVYRAQTDPTGNPAAWVQTNILGTPDGYAYDEIFDSADGPIYFGPTSMLGVPTSITDFDYVRVTPDEGTDCPEPGDNTAPVTTHSFDPATADGSGGAWLPGVELSLAATDNESAPGDIDTFYRIGTEGAWLPYTGAITFDDEGSFTVQYYSEDEAGNEETPKSATFSVAEDTGPVPCTTAFSDGFDGTSLDSKWSYRWGGAATPPALPVVTGGNLEIQLGTGELDGGSAGPIGFSGQPIPEGDWQLVTHVNTPGLASDTGGVGGTDWAQAGLMLYQTDGDFIKSGKVRVGDQGAGSTATYFEAAAENNGTIARSARGSQSAANPVAWWHRLTKVGNTITADYALTDPDTGGTWLPVNVSGGTPWQANYATVFDGSDPVYAGGYGALGVSVAQFDYININPDCDLEPCVDLSDDFDGTGAYDDSKWSYRWGGVTTPPALPTTSAGSLNLPSGAWSLDLDRPGPIGFIGQPMPEGDWTAIGKFNTPGMGTDTSGTSAYAQAGFNLYQTNNNWVKAVATRNADGGAPANQTYFEFTTEIDTGVALGQRNNGPRTGTAAGNPDTWWARLSSEDGLLSYSYALSDPETGGTWIDVPAPTAPAAGPNDVDVLFPTAAPIYLGVYAGNSTATRTVDFVHITTECDDPEPPVDTTAPVTTHAMVPATANGSGGAWLPGADVTLSATDNVSTPANIDTFYRVGTSGAWIPYTAAIDFPAEGSFTLQYYSEDEAGNDETPKSTSFVIAENDEEPGGCALSDDFDGTSLDSKWNKSWTGAATPLPPAPTVSGGYLNQPMGALELSAAVPNGQGPIAFTGQQVPAGDWEITSRIDMTNVNAPDGIGFSQSGLMLYQNDQNFIKLVKIQTEDGANAFWESASRNGAGAPAATNNYPGNGSIGSSNIVWFRFLKVADRVHVYRAATDPVGNPAAWIQTNLLATEQGYNYNGIFAEADGPVYFGGVGMLGAPTSITKFDYINVTPDSGGGECEPSDDETPPETEAELTPTAPDGLNGWYTSPVEVDLTATDEVGGSGVKNVQHRPGTSGPFTVVPGDSATVDLTTTGVHTLEYFATDNANNEEDVKTLSDVSIDTAAPTTTAELSPEPDDEDMYSNPVTVTLDAGDNANGSGVDKTEYSLDDGDSWIEYTVPFSVVGVGEHTVLYRSTDVAGLVEADKTVTFEIAGSDVETCIDNGVEAPLVLNLDPTPGTGVTDIQYRVTAEPDDPESSTWTAYTIGTPIVINTPGIYRIDYKYVTSGGTTVSHSLCYTVVEPAPPAKLSIKLNKKKLNLGAKKKAFNLTATIANTGGSNAGSVKLCIKAPKKKIKVQGAKCRTVSIAVGASRKIKVKFKAKKPLKGKKGKVTFTVTSPGHKKLTQKAQIKQKK